MLVSDTLKKNKQNLKPEKTVKLEKVLSKKKNRFVTKFLKFNPICTGGGEANLPSPLTYFNIAPKLKKSFALMHPDVESNSITHIFR